jgi:hypothetical protein
MLELFPPPYSTAFVEEPENNSKPLPLPLGFAFQLSTFNVQVPNARFPT